MKAEFINPFLHSIVNVLTTMAQMEVSAAPHSKKWKYRKRGCNENYRLGR